MKKVFRIFGYSLVVMIFLMAIIIGMTQTAIFKEWVRQFAEREAAEHLNGELRVGNISGTFITGLRLNDVEWWYEDTRVISIQSLDLRLNPSHLLQNSIVIDNIVIINPEVRLSKDDDGVLNISRIARKREPGEIEESDTAEVTGSGRWTYEVRSLEILGGSFSFIDHTAGLQTELSYPVEFLKIDYTNLRVENIYLTMSAISDGHNHSVNIRSMNFVVDDPLFTVSHFSLQAAVSLGRTQINRMRLITDRSNVNITGGISGYNVLGGNDGDITDKELDVNLYADRFHFDDLKMLIPAVWFLEGEVGLDLSVRGTLDQLGIEKLYLKTGRTELVLEGSLTDLSNQDRFFIDAGFSDSRIDPADINALLPYFAIPDYSHLGVLDMGATYSGRPKDFNAAIDLHTSAGLYSGNVRMDMTGPQLRYDASVVMRDADITAIMQNKYYPYDLAGRITLKGEGTKLDDVIAEVALFIDHMKIAHLEFDSLHTNVRAHYHDILLSSTGSLEQSEFRLDASGAIESIEDAPVDLRLAFHSLDLARIMQDSSFSSDLTFSLSSNTTGLKPESILGEIAMELEPSRFRGYEFVGEPVYLSLVEFDTTFRELKVNSEILDVYLAGEFDLPTIAGISYDHVRQLISSIRNDIQGIVTGEVVEVPDLIGSFEIQNPLDTVYDITIKNIDAIAILLGRDAFDVEVEGSLYGYFRARDNMLHLGGDIEIDHFLYLSENQRVLFDKVIGWYNIDNDYQAPGLQGIFTVFDLSVAGIYSQSLTVHDAQLRADIKGNDWSVFSKAVIDTVIGYEFDAFGRFETTSLNTDIPTFALRYGDLDFSNRDTIQMRYDNEGVWFDTFTLYHNDVTTVDLNGLFAFDREHDIDFSIQNVDLREIHLLAVPDAPQRRLPIFTGRADIAGTLGGTNTDLTSSMDIRLADMKYGEISFGILNGSFDYEGKRLNFSTEMTGTEDTSLTVFKIHGYMPFDLLPGSGGERIPDGPLDVKIFSDGFDLSIVDPFLTELRNFRARMTSNVSINGTIENPRYQGDLEFFDGQFTFLQNNVTYFFYGEIEPRQNELVISQLRLENRRRDLPDGRMNFTGNIRTRGLTIRDFDIRADGQLMVLRTASRRPGDVFYGDLTIATGANGMRLAGSPERSNVTGTLLIRSAQLTFPPARTTAYDRTGSIVNYIVIEDADETPETPTPLELFIRDIAEDKGTHVAQQETGSTFLDGLDYDIIIQTDGRVELTMIFNQATAEELGARIETTSLRLYRDDLTGMRLIGNVNIVEPSAYSFYRRFDARGRISFVGPPDNPELDITATYAGQRIAVAQTTTDPDAPPSVTGGVPEPVEVRLHITGDRYEPHLDITLLVNNEEWEGDVETDAISFILTGRFQTELDSGDYRGISADFGRGIPATFMSGVATSLLSNLFSDFLRNEVRFIRTAEIVWYGGNIMDTAELRISGELRNFYWTIGGRVFNDIGNTNFSFQIPMGPVFNSDRWTNLFLELERRSQSLEYSEEQRPVNAARLYYSISF